MFGKFVHPCIEVCQELFLIYVNLCTRKMLCMVTGVYCYPNTCWFQYLLIGLTFLFILLLGDGYIHCLLNTTMSLSLMVMLEWMSVLY